MKNVSFVREAELRYDVDVLVVGGGPAGCAAAVMAARQGASVLVVDAAACFGGLGAAAMIPAFMPFGDEKAFCADGFGREIANRIIQIGGKSDDEPPYGFSIRVEALKRAYEDILQEAGVQILLHAQAIGLEMDGSKITHVVFNAKSGLFAARAKVYVDGSGDADLAAWAGAPYEKGDENGNLMAGTLCSIYTGIDWKRVQPLPQNRRIEEAYNDGVFTTLDKHLPGFWKISDTLGGGNIGHTFGVDPLDEASMTKAIVYGRRLVTEYERYYREYLPGHESMELVVTGYALGIRESRRIVGDYVLVLDDFINQSVFKDEIGRYNYPVDIHASDDSNEEYESYHKGITTYRYKAGENYGIPYRVLLPKGVENLLVAGKTVSADRAMQSSIRVMPGCYITGQAAGTAAAMAAKGDGGVRGIDIRGLQSSLKNAGAYLPNYAG